jgi:hypothetical protein
MQEQALQPTEIVDETNHHFNQCGMLLGITTDGTRGNFRVYSLYFQIIQAYTIAGRRGLLR